MMPFVWIIICCLECSDVRLVKNVRKTGLQQFSCNMCPRERERETETETETERERGPRARGA